MFDHAEFFGHLVVECLVQPGQERDRGRAGQGALAVHLVYRPLDDDMRARFQGQRAGFFFKLRPGQGPFNVARPGVVPLDEVRIIAVHHSNEVGKFGGTVRVQPQPEPCCLSLDIHREVGQLGRNGLFEEARLDPAGCFQHSCRSPGGVGTSFIAVF